MRGEDDVWQREACMPLVVPAFELRLKKAKLEIVRDTLQDHSPLWWRGVDMVWGLLLGRSDVWKQRHSTNAP